MILNIMPFLYSSVFTLILFFIYSLEYSFIPYIIGELLIFYLTSMSFRGRVLRAILWFVGINIVSLQVISIISTGDYILPLTFSNLNAFRAVGGGTLIKLLLVYFLYLVSFVLLFFTSRKIAKVFILPIFLLFLLNGPTYNLFKSLFDYYRQESFVSKFDKSILDKYHKKDIVFNSNKSDFLGKTNIRNVIIVFMEGTSAIIPEYKLDDTYVMPNLNQLLSSSFSVENFFNHTAATYRGLRGQLSSTYQLRGGFYIEDRNKGIGQMSNSDIVAKYSNGIVTLPKILNNVGFNTSFIVDEPATGNMTTYIKSLGFKKVYSSEESGWNSKNSLPDKLAFESLKRVVSNQGNDKPFFIGIYTAGTHHGMDSDDLKFKDGKNPYYNKFYNADVWLGEFVNWFKNSEYYGNTLLIITADHATFPAPDYKESFNTDIDHFVDRVPLVMIGGGMPIQKFDAEGRTSIDLTPTVLDLLNINKFDNYFLGCSLFDRGCNSKFSHSVAIGNGFFEIRKDNGKYKAILTEPNVDIMEYYNISE